MPRSRLVLLIWVIGSIGLLGLWGHSLFRKSIMRYQIVNKDREATLGIVCGSVEFTWRSVYEMGSNRRNRLQAFIFKLEKGAVPGVVPDYKLGRFHYERIEVGSPPRPLFRTTIEFPIWVLLALYSILLFPFYRRSLKRERTPPAGPSPGEHENT